jgi:hypothetical protein
MVPTKLVRALRIFSGAVATLAVLFVAFCLWIAVHDYSIQVRHHWEHPCGDIIMPAIFFAFVGGVITSIGVVAYRKTAAWERRLHGAQQV